MEWAGTHVGAGILTGCVYVSEKSGFGMLSVSEEGIDTTSLVSGLNPGIPSLHATLACLLRVATGRCLSWFAAAARRRMVSEGEWALKLRRAYFVHKTDVHLLLELPIDVGHFQRAARCKEQARRQLLAGSKRDEKWGAYQGILEHSTLDVEL